MSVEGKLTGAMIPWLSKAGQICLQAAKIFCTRVSGRSLRAYFTSSHSFGSLDSFCKFSANLRTHIVPSDGIWSAVCKLRTENVDVDGAVGWDCGVGMSSLAALRRFAGGPPTDRDGLLRPPMLLVSRIRCEGKGQRYAVSGSVMHSGGMRGSPRYDHTALPLDN